MKNIKGKYRKSAALIMLCCLCAFCFFGCKKKEENKASEPFTVKIGVVHDFTGEGKEEAEQIYQAVCLAAEEINAAGGVLTEQYMLEVIKKDDKGDSMSAVAAYYELVQEGACVVIGVSTDEGMAELVNVSGRENVPVITVTVTSDEVVSGADFCFQACFSDKYMTQAMAAYAKDRLGVSRAAVIYDVRADESGAENGGSSKDILLYEDFVASALAQGIQVVYAAAAGLTEGDELEQQFLRIQETGAEAVFVPPLSLLEAWGSEGLKELFEAAEKAGYTGSFLGTPEYEGVWDTCGYQVYIPVNMAYDSTDSKIGEFVEYFCGKSGYEPEQLKDGVRPAYEAVYYLRDAIEAGYLAAPVSVALKLPFLTGSTPLGDYGIGAYGNVGKAVEFYYVRDGKREYSGIIFE